MQIRWTRHAAGVRQDNRRSARCRQCAADLEQEQCVGISLHVQRERACQSGRRREAVDARRQHEATQILSCQVDIARCARCCVVRRSEVGLGLLRHRIGGVDRSAGNDAGRKSCDGTARSDTDISIDHSRTGVGDR